METKAVEESGLGSDIFWREMRLTSGVINLCGDWVIDMGLLPRVPSSRRSVMLRRAIPRSLVIGRIRVTLLGQRPRLRVCVHVPLVRLGWPRMMRSRTVVLTRLGGLLRARVNGDRELRVHLTSLSLVGPFAPLFGLLRSALGVIFPDDAIVGRTILSLNRLASVCRSGGPRASNGLRRPGRGNFLSIRTV